MIDLLSWDTLRWINVALALACLIGMTARRAWWRLQSPDVRLLLIALGTLVVATWYAHLEVVLRGGQPGSIRILLFTPALAWILIAQLHARPHRKEKR